MRPGSLPFRLLRRLRSRRIVRRRDLDRLRAELGDVDKAMRRLVAEGLADRIGRGVWLVPSGERPQADVPRYWSNPGLQDAGTIIRVTLANPTIADVTRLVLSYGIGKVGRGLEEARGELRPELLARASRYYENACAGIHDAASRLSA